MKQDQDAIKKGGVVVFHDQDSRENKNMQIDMHGYLYGLPWWLR